MKNNNWLKSSIKLILCALAFSCSNNDKVNSVPEVQSPIVNTVNPAINELANKNISVIGSLTPLAKESSGIVFTDGFIWTHNDSGNSNLVYKVDPTNGKIIQVITINGFKNIDWEDITTDANFLYLEDAGNNDGIRTDLRVLKIAKNQFINNNDAAVTVNAEEIKFSYSEQTSFVSSNTHNFDCESILSVDENLYLFTKDRGDFQTRVYKLPKTPGSYVITAYTSFDVKGLITGADYNPATQQIALIGYQSSHRTSFIYLLNNFTSDNFFSGTNKRIEIGNNNNDWQTEGIAFKNDTELYLSCESTTYIAASLFSTKIN
ncbi:hypothetical protein [Flavobacterium sp. 7A]|uniref:hypothetical protein n=1 Tax=Flavobacterium sp. 7A TaxID=2940571 RepID=UPI0022272F94|nr:hypothetical protein [Flavobacterium sp. 7A]MCW2119249.1 hypothetical protein [Flavobacterium sp. 7A]